MQELIDKLKANNGLDDTQAKEVLRTITDFVKDKFPMIGGAVDNMFGSSISESPASLTDNFTPKDITNAEQLLKDKQSGFYEGNKTDY